VTNAEQALALLTDMNIGDLAADNKYPEGSFNALVANRIEQWAELHKHDKDSHAHNDD